MIRLEIPASLEYRDLAVRTVAAAAKLVGDGRLGNVASRRDFENQIVSAFGEAFNNIVLHGHRGRPDGELAIEIEPLADRIVVRFMDHGHCFDAASADTPPLIDPDDPLELDDLPDSGFGLFIIRSFVDELAYRAGSPNVLSLTKRFRGGIALPPASPIKSQRTHSA